jgi:hypothetical protein
LISEEPLPFFPKGFGGLNKWLRGFAPDHSRKKHKDRRRHPRFNETKKRSAREPSVERKADQKCALVDGIHVFYFRDLCFEFQGKLLVWLLVESAEESGAFGISSFSSSPSIRVSAP